MEKIYQITSEELVQNLATNLNAGLTKEESKNRLLKNGPNELDRIKGTNFFMKLLSQFQDFMIIVLLAAALISIFSGDIPEGILIVAIVIINALFGVIQETRAEKSLEAIRELSSPHILVIRDGIEENIDVKDLVVGDLVVLSAGDYVPADLRIIESVSLKIDESALTGESVAVDKTSDPILDDELALGDQTNLAFMSTIVTYGRGLGIVIRTAMDTEIGKIATMLTEPKSTLTPLQKSINQLGKTLALIALGITLLIFAIDIATVLVQTGGLSFNALKDSFTFAVALAVAAIPEGLPAIITVVLSLGMSNLVKQKAIMKNLPSVETLGSTNVICSDKTGTLTQNVMTVKKVFVNNEFLTDEDKLNPNYQKLVEYGVLASDVKVRIENDSYVTFGDPTEIALINLSINHNINPTIITDKYPRINELPFDSKRKLMSSINEIDGKTYLITKGAPDVLFRRLKDQSNVEKLQKANEDMAIQALRVLAVGYKEVDPKADLSNYDLVEQDLIFVGLVGMIDPERVEVKDAIALCDSAGITTIMITGDHKNTAMAIAKNIGIMKKGDLSITGLELDKLSDEEFNEKLEHIKVYARVSPENKVRIVEAWQARNMVVAMTGDGVNDAPSIKTANIGIAMGITGTEVAKGAADMILTDDNFATIVNAVGEGRAIFANIKKAIHYLLSCNVGEILAMLLGVTIGVFLFRNNDFFDGHVLIAAQILWVNLVTDSLMAIALGFEHREPNIMEQPPRDNDKSIFADGLGKTVVWQGLMIGLITFAAFLIGWHVLPNGGDDALQLTNARTIAFMTMSISQLFHAFNTRSLRFSNTKLKMNKMMIYAFFASLTLQLIVVFVPPFRNLFEIAMPDFLGWVFIIVLSVLPLLIVEIIKLIQNKVHKNKETLAWESF